MSKRPRDEFFEVFRRSPGEPSKRTSWTGLAGKPSDRFVRRGVLILSYGALILCVTVAVVAVVLAYTLGYSRGKARGDASAQTGGAVAAKSERSVGSSSPTNVVVTANEPAPPAPGEPFYTVRVMSAVPPANAVQLRDDLRAMGYRDVFVYEARGTTGHTVNIGRFSTLQDRTAQELKEEIRDRTYKGNRAFKDAYIIKITNPGRAIE